MTTAARNYDEMAAGLALGDESNITSPPDDDTPPFDYSDELAAGGFERVKAQQSNGKANGHAHNGKTAHVNGAASEADPPAHAEWPVPADLWSPIAPVPALPRGLLPCTIEAFAFGKPEVFNPAALAAAALATCAIATTDNIRLVINPTWRERFCLWVAPYGSSSAMKSPTKDAAMRPLVREQTLRLEEYQRDKERWEQAKKTAAQSGSDMPFNDPKPVAVRYITHSATIEALTEIEKLAPHGVGLVHDELSALISAMDGYKEKGASERGNWLAGYDGGAFYSDRIGRGEVFVENHSFSILGCITTEKLARIVRDSVADGLMSRMTLCSVPVMPPSDDLEAMPAETYQEYSRLISRLVNNRPKPCAVALTEEARKILGARKKRWQEEAVLYADRLPRYAERLGKLTGVAARVSLGFAIIEAAEIPGTQTAYREIDAPRSVTPDQARRACEYVDYQARHDLAFYAAAAGQDVVPAISMARRVAGWLLQLNRECFHLGDLTRGILEWRSLKSTDQFATLDLLDNLGWIRPSDENYFRGVQFVRGIVWSVNPRVHQIYESQAQAARQVAADAKRRLAEAVKERQ